MPALSNPRHERFCEEIENGKNGTEAYASAFGRKPDATARASASRLLAQGSIKARIAERQDARSEMARKASQTAADALALDREWVLARLRDNALAAAAKEDFGPSNRALELIGKEIAGMFVDRSESKVSLTRSHEDMLDELEREPVEEIALTAH